MAENDFMIAVFDGGTDSVLKLDLKFLNLKFHRVYSKQFERFIDLHYEYLSSNDGTFVSNYSNTFFHYLQNDQPGGFHPNLYALVPIDHKKSTSIKTIHNISRALLLMFPSDFQLSAIIEYDTQASGKYQENGMSTWNYMTHAWVKNTGNPLNELLIKIEERLIPRANKFLRIAYNFVSKPNDFEVAIDSYMEAFAQKSAKMAYLNYCISLESLTKAETEITYQISRTTAVINADSKTDGEIIFFNMKQFYTLRSKIVHGSRPGSLSEYFFRLQALVSRTLIEIATLSISNREALAKFVNENGYGDKKKLSPRYRKQVFNDDVLQAIVERVSKYKSS